MGRLRSVLARMGLVSPPLVPHEFESAMHLLSHPPSAGASVATVPHIVTPTTSAECARDGCCRSRNDSIHSMIDA